MVQGFEVHYCTYQSVDGLFCWLEDSSVFLLIEPLEGLYRVGRSTSMQSFHPCLPGQPIFSPPIALLPPRCLTRQYAVQHSQIILSGQLPLTL